MPTTKATRTSGKTRTPERRDDELEGVQDIDDFDGEGTATALYGRSNSGKTTLAATWPTPLLLLDVRDRGSRSISDAGKKVKKKRIQTFEDLEDTYWWIYDHPKAYATIVIDTVTQLQQIVIEDIYKRKRKKGRSAGDWGSMAQRDWGDVSALMKEWIINFRDLKDRGIHVVFIAQDRTFNFTEEEEEAEDMLAPEVGPALSPATAKTLNAAVDVIGNTFIRSQWVDIPGTEKKGKKPDQEEKIDFCLRVGPNSLYVTKVRKPKSIRAPKILVDPSFDDIMDLMEGK